MEGEAEVSPSFFVRSGVFSERTLRTNKHAATYVISRPLFLYRFRRDFLSNYKSS